MEQGNTFGGLYSRSFLKPAQQFTALLEHPRMLRYAFYAMFINVVAYTLVYVFLIYGDGRPFKPWLAIPAEVYYRYNVFFVAPTMLMGWILAAGVLQTITRAFTDKGSFEEILVLLGFAISIASWSTSVHDVVSSFLGAVHIIDQQHYEHLLNTPTIWRNILWFLFLLYFAWFLGLFTLSVKLVYKLRWLPSVLLGFLGFAIYQLFFLIFNR